jgi:hypothetical protein
MHGYSASGCRRRQPFNKDDTLPEDASDSVGSAPMRPAPAETCVPDGGRP